MKTQQTGFVPETINDSRLKAIGKDFPWFLNWFKQMQEETKVYQIKEVRVERTDPSLVQRPPRNQEQIVIFDKEGKRLGKVGITAKIKSRYEWFMDIMFGFENSWLACDGGETVEMAILRLVEWGHEPYFVVTYSIVSNESTGHSLAATATLHKPKGPSLNEWLASLRDEQVIVLKKQLEAIG